ncbi:hypothetical protein IRZ48_03515 [Pseudomonas fulva]|uniref:hypothetical protein n=1 Tax=Pseudomonas fulva TaxID=47880 RepID=UPI0018ABA516|nr:hypothetical protein [Pseudomonas fulva]MBF8635611.1 hypothetical protein [Pseudomonas fulva]MBF8687664.1 hypothetical protein [Pseudomonas fulva]
MTTRAWLRWVSRFKEAHHAHRSSRFIRLQSPGQRAVFWSAYLTAGSQPANHGLADRALPPDCRSSPTLKDTNQLSLVRVNPDGQSSTTLPLVDEILKAKLHNRVLDFTPVANINQYLLLSGKHFFAIPDPFETAEGDQIDLVALQPAFEDLLLLLDDYFNAARVKYWRAVGSMGVSRDRWLQLVMKTALLHNLSLHGLSAR